MSDEDSSSSVRRRLQPGQWVEIKNRFDGEFGPGFVVEAVLDSGYRVRRLRDGAILPVEVPFDDVRVVARVGGKLSPLTPPLEQRSSSESGNAAWSST